MIRRFKVGYRVDLHKRTLETSLLSLIGPQAGTVAASAIEVGELPDAEREHAHTLARIAGVSTRLIRTDLGIDALFESGALDSVVTALETGAATVVSEDAAEIVRVESGRPRYGVDVDESTIPQEAGLNERAVSFTKGCYVGQETVARLHYRGKPNRHLRGLRLSEPAASGTELHLGDRAVGRLGSSVVSPRRGPIALALVRREVEPGTCLALGESDATASVVELPFQ
jgi:folate-binding protein YgfZ